MYTERHKAAYKVIPFSPYGKLFKLQISCKSVILLKLPNGDPERSVYMSFIQWFSDFSIKGRTTPTGFAIIKKTWKIISTVIQEDLDVQHWEELEWSFIDDFPTEITVLKVNTAKERKALDVSVSWQHSHVLSVWVSAPKRQTSSNTESWEICKAKKALLLFETHKSSFQYTTQLAHMQQGWLHTARGAEKDYG